MEEEYSIESYNGKEGIFDINEEEVVPFNYDEIEWIRYNKIAKLRLNNKWGFVDLINNYISPVVYDGISMKTYMNTKMKKRCYSDFFTVELRDYLGVVNLKNEAILPIVFDEITVLRGSGKYIKVRKKFKWGVYSSDGEKLIPIKFDSLSYEGSHKLILAKKKRNWGIINLKNDIIVRFKYKFEAVYFEEPIITKSGNIVVQKDGQCGIINLSEGIVVDFLYDEIGDYNYENDTFKVRTGSFSGRINSFGKIIEPLEMIPKGDMGHPVTEKSRFSSIFSIIGYIIFLLILSVLSSFFIWFGVGYVSWIIIGLFNFILPSVLLEFQIFKYIFVFGLGQLICFITFIMDDSTEKYYISQGSIFCSIMILLITCFFPFLENWLYEFICERSMAEVIWYGYILYGSNQLSESISSAPVYLYLLGHISVLVYYLLTHRISPEKIRL